MNTKAKYMKTAKFYIAFITGAMLISCSSDDPTVDQVVADTTRGAVLRTVSTTNDMVYNDVTLSFEEGSSYSLTIEAQDNEGGTLLGSVNIYARFIDNTLLDTNEDGEIDEDDDDFSTTENLLSTVQASAFSEGPFGFPRTTVTFTSDELVTATIIDDDIPRGLDQFGLRLELVLTDGRTFTSTDVSGNVSGGSFFSSPFDYRSEISCAITEDLSGDHTYVTTMMVSGSGEEEACGASVGGTVTWEDSETPGMYTTSDLSFGQFVSCGADSPATSEDAVINWSCSSLEVLGTDQDDNSYTYEITSVTGAEMTISWQNTSGDSGVTVLTRAEDVPWPDIFLDNNN